MKRLILVGLLLCLTSIDAPGGQSDNFIVRPQEMTSGGSTGTSNSFALNSTVGQPSPVGLGSSDNIVLTSGYGMDIYDADRDGITNVLDNCEYDYNPDQEDLDEDDWGDICDCDENDPDVNPGAEEGPPQDPNCFDDIDNDCDGDVDEDDFGCFCWDNDVDGYSSDECGGEDCDDDDPDVNPGMIESIDDDNCLDTLDNDCDGDTDLDDGGCVPCADQDDDGYGFPASENCEYSDEDCDDFDADVNPGAIEGPQGDPTCTDGLDNDCDGLVDSADNPDCCFISSLF